MSFRKFVLHYADEAQLLVNTIRLILPATPINPHDREQVSIHLTALEGAVNSIREGADRLSDEIGAATAPAEVSREALDAALAETLPGLVVAEVARQIEMLASTMNENVERVLPEEINRAVEKHFADQPAPETREEPAGE
jgi:hypothetical protein